MSEIVFQLTHIARFGAQYRNRRLEVFGLNNRQASLLLEICATPGISQDTLARRVFLDKSVVARLLANLEEKGFVDRPTSQKDRRVTCLHPTEKALELLPKLQAVWLDCEQFFTEGLNTEEVAALQALLAHVQSHAVQGRDEE